MDKAKAILERLDIDITYHGQDYVACSTGYREGDTSTGVLCRDSHVFDVVLGRRMEWDEFVAKVKKISLEDARKWLAGAKIENGDKEFEEKEDRIDQPKYLNEADYSNTVKSYKFFLDRGISKETLDYFGAELSNGGAFYGRILFKIRDEKGKLIGVAGRDALNRGAKYPDFPKWANKAPKSKWVYPIFHKNIEAIQKTRQIIPVESIGDALALCDAGYWQVTCNFGLFISPSRLAFLLKMNPSKILLGWNDDKESEQNRGQVGAAKARKKLSSFFSSEKIVNAPPLKNDFGEMSKEEIGEWADKYGVIKSC